MCLRSLPKLKVPLQKKILLRIGADKVISQKRETGISLAKHLIHRSTTSVFELGGNVSIVEFRPPKKWFGKTLAELQLRQNLQNEYHRLPLWRKSGIKHSIDT